MRKTLINKLSEKYNEPEFEIDWMLADIEAIAGEPQLKGYSLEELFDAWWEYSNKKMFAGWMVLGGMEIPTLVKWLNK